MQCYSYPASLLNQDEIPVELSTNYVLNEHEHVDKYDPYATPSEIMPCEIYPESLVNQDWLKTYHVNKPIWP